MIPHPTTPSCARSSTTNCPGAKVQKRELANEFESIYRCAFLLFVIGDPADSPRLCRAKFGTGHFDLATGFDAQAIFGAGRGETLEWLRTSGFAAEEATLMEWLARWEDPTVEAWAEFRRGYFYSPEGELLLDPI